MLKVNMKSVNFMRFTKTGVICVGKNCKNICLILYLMNYNTIRANIVMP